MKSSVTKKNTTQFRTENVKRERAPGEKESNNSGSINKACNSF